MIKQLSNKSMKRKKIIIVVTSVAGVALLAYLHYKKTYRKLENVNFNMWDEHQTMFDYVGLVKHV